MLNRPARVCAVITATTCSEARRLLQSASSRADIAELRLDYLNDFDFTRYESLAPILADKPIPVIITCRAADEGGVRPVDDSIRLPLLIEGARRFADYCDVEASRYEQASALNPDISRLIVSYHNFIETPPDVEQIYSRISKFPAAIYKIATKARDIADVLPVFRLLAAAQSENRGIIALAMGSSGLMTRILGPAHGSFLTYSSIEEGAESAPGQVSIDDLLSLYRVRQLTPKTAIAGVVGKPVAHSASPAMHNAAFSSLGLDAVYLPLDVDDIRLFFSRFVRPATRELEWNPLGFSITIPHKSAVIRSLDEIDDTAREAGAVNTVVIRETRLIGYNTDVQGAMEPLERLISLRGAECAVIGAGGAARAVVYGLVSRGARVTLFARDRWKAEALAASFGVSAAPLDNFASSPAEVVINCTPVGMRGKDEGESPLEQGALRGRKVVYDLVYNPLQTRLLDHARAASCLTLSGLEMLVAQAALQFQLWTGKPAPIDLMRNAALAWLSRE